MFRPGAFHIITLCGLVLLAAPAASQAWDGDRAGFLLGAGLGLGRSDLEAPSDTFFRRSDRELNGVATDIKIGYAFDSDTAIAVDIKRVTGELEYEDGGSSGIDYYNRLIALSLIQWSGSKTPAALVTIGAGWRVIADEDGFDEIAGASLQLGVGVEAAPHLYFELTFSPAITDLDGWDVTTLVLTINLLGY